MSWAAFRGRLTGTIDWRYAVGEVSLIVIGILIALAASEWQTARAERRTELALLGELRTGLAADLISATELLDRAPYEQSMRRAEESVAVESNVILTRGT